MMLAMIPEHAKLFLALRQSVACELRTHASPVWWCCTSCGLVPWICELLSCSRTTRTNGTYGDCGCGWS
jgi:hypothetical protein